MTDLRHDWTPERVGQLKEFWAEGHSAKAIQKLMGLPSRSAVLGKVHRLGLPSRREGLQELRDARRAVRSVERKKNEAKRQRRAELRANLIVIHKRKHSKPLPTPAKEPVELPPLNIPFADRTAFQCAWIAGEPKPDATCCGLPTIAGSAWCEWHWKLCYVPVVRRLR